MPAYRFSVAISDTRLDYHYSHWGSAAGSLDF